MIMERRRALTRDDLDDFEMDKRILALATLIDARDRLDEIAAMKEQPDVVEHIKFTGTDESGRKIRARRPRRLRQQHAV
jgi:hypothetical protein